MLDVHCDACSVTDLIRDKKPRILWDSCMARSEAGESMTKVLRFSRAPAATTASQSFSAARIQNPTESLSTPSIGHRVRGSTRSLSSRPYFDTNQDSNVFCDRSANEESGNMHREFHGDQPLEKGTKAALNRLWICTLPLLPVLNRSTKAPWMLRRPTPRQPPREWVGLYLLIASYQADATPRCTFSRGKSHGTAKMRDRKSSENIRPVQPHHESRGNKANIPTHHPFSSHTS